MCSRNISCEICIFRGFTYCLDHLVLQFNNKEKSQVIMGTRDGIVLFVVEYAVSIRQSGCYIAVQPALH